MSSCARASTWNTSVPRLEPSGDFEMEELDRKRFRHPSTLLEATLRDHAAWLEAGRRGEGRLVVSDTWLQGATWIGKPLEGAVFRNTWLQDVRFTSAQLAEAAFIGCRLDAVSFLMADLQRSQWSQGVLADVQMDLTDGEGLVMQDCDLRGGRLRRIRWQESRLERVDLSGARLRGAKLSGSTWVGCNLSGADFRDDESIATVLTGARLEQCDLSGAQFPEGTDVVCVDCLGR